MQQISDAGLKQVVYEHALFCENMQDDGFWELGLYKNTESSFNSKLDNKGEGKRLDLSGYDLSHADLADLYLAQANFSNVDLSEATLDSSDLSDAYLKGASLTAAALNRVTMDRAVLIGADFYNANLCSASLNGANLERASLREVMMNEAKLVAANLEGVNLEGSLMHRVDLTGANLKNACLQNANLTDADLTNADLTQCDMRGVNLRGACLSGAIGLGKVSRHSIALVRRIAKIVLDDPTGLEMNTPHQCETTHCLAGWVCVLDSTAHNLEPLLGWNAAACLAVPIPEFTSLFYSDNEQAMSFLWKVRRREFDWLG